ncbi:hypothetical protein LX36DRAFT_63503 [Colletotrichum falcatum]|nr:hypothetical protein LX36DRAFT_63503 [Colletotrichum falcatum]
MPRCLPAAIRTQGVTTTNPNQHHTNKTHDAHTCFHHPWHFYLFIHMHTLSHHSHTHTLLTLAACIASVTQRCFLCDRSLSLSLSKSSSQSLSQSHCPFRSLRIHCKHQSVCTHTVIVRKKGDAANDKRKTSHQYN